MAAVAKEHIAPTVSADDLTALHQVVEHFDRTQLIWSSGYLAGLAGSTAPVAAVPVPAPATETWHIFFATETGNSRQVAADLAERASLNGVTTELHDLSQTRPKFLKTVENAVFVLATHGIGEAPEGSEAFFEFWLSDKAPQLSGLKYSVLALGDSSYVDFCEMGRVFDQRLAELGGTAIIDRVDCDLDFEAAASAWTAQIVETAGEAAVESAPSPTRLTAVSSSAAYGKNKPFSAEILSQQRITGRGSSKDVQHIELDLEGSGLSYIPGDSLGVWPTNPPQLVDDLLKITGLDNAAIAGKEITALSRPILDAVAEEHADLREMLEDRGKFSDYLATRQLLDLVHEFPVDWQQPQFAGALRDLSPRSYSIASSPAANPGEAHLTVAVVDYEKFGRRHWGAASNFLTGDITHAPVFIEPNNSFRLPEDGGTPIVMIGAGTGVAPYRAFVEHRREHGHTGDNWLVFGDRNLASDFLYQLEWLRYREEGLLKHLDVAFSRDQAEKIYVQDRIIENGKRLFDWLERGAHLYVCGDAAHMAGDVHAALLAVVGTHAGVSPEQAAEYLRQLKQAGRYQRDVY